METRQRFTTKSRVESFKYAFGGIVHVFRTQHNAWIHAAINVAVVVLALWLKASPIDWAVLVLAMMAVWVSEFINTAVEAVVDVAADGEISSMAGVAKDVAAGAVLVAAAGSVVVGLLVLGPPLWDRLFG